MAGNREVKVSVHDGLAMRTLTVKTSDSFIDVLENISALMKRPNTQVEMGYEAPWSTKIGSKKSLAYITTDEELENFWSAYVGYVKKGGKKQLDANGSVLGIVFHNMKQMEGAQVSKYLLY